VGLLARFLEKRMKDPMEGTAKVLAMDPEELDSIYDAGMHMDTPATSGGYVMDCEVSAPGLNPTSVRHKGDALASKWPSIGDTLPIVVDRAQPKRFVIEWNKL
jgi:hypothetical protein